MKPLADMGRFAVVVVDPPWPLTKTRRKVRPNQHGFDYQTMTLDEIAALPILECLAKNAWLFVWATQRFLPSTFDLLTTWDCRYRLTLTWHKHGGFQPFGLPQFNSEFAVVGSVGSPKFTDTRAFFTANHWPRGAHSEKPEGFYDLLRRVTPEPRLDVFGRRRIAGFHSWGNEAPEGPPPPTHYQTVLGKA